uniref:Uncharacterized protein n=1 Tax=Riptortus pedestris TaxID=329032 RepID=R4WPA2_RIPPE|nr:conserved hypothetical protein [Riptortus pedestris]
MDDSNKIPTNHELVDALIDDFKATCDIKPREEAENANKSESSLPKDFSDFPDKCPCDDEDSERSKEEKPKADDYIDEEELKAKEELYSEDDLQRLKSEAEQLKATGNQQFKNQEFRESAFTYTSALRICPLAFAKDRSILYANRAAAKIKLELTESAIEDCSKAIELEPNYVKALLRRAQLYENSEKLDEALADYKRVVELDPSHTESINACHRLPIEINERNEKLKTEMLGKLKDLGNVILRPFGLSTNNFQMVQDPNTGGYSISFKQN